MAGRLILIGLLCHSSPQPDNTLATHRDDHALLSLPVLALLIGVHVKTLRAAARDGRLPVTYDTRTTFRRLRARATLAITRQFRHSYFGRQVRRADRREPPSWASVPDDYDVQMEPGTVLGRGAGNANVARSMVTGGRGDALRQRGRSVTTWGGYLKQGHPVAASRDTEGSVPSTRMEMCSSS